VSDGTDWEYEEEFPERPFGPKPFGPKPFGPKPFGPKPFGPKPFGPKPFGPKPFGPKPFGPKGPDAGFLDRDAWSTDIAELVCERSVVIRLGATLVTSDEAGPLPTPAVPFEVNADVRAPGSDEPAAGKERDGQTLRPGEWRLSAGVALSPRIRSAVQASAELADALKVDLAEALARRADEIFLQGSGTECREPKGITKHVTPKRLGRDPLGAARNLVTAVRKSPTPTFRNPGWILGPATLDALTRLVTSDGLKQGGSGARSLDSHRLLQLDGVDGGVLLGFPFLISTGAGPNVYFAADWQEAWIGLDPYGVSVYLSAEPRRAGAEGIVIRASMPFDFALRDTAVFSCATA
jgi:HK97 family phage major capsid protein